MSDFRPLFQLQPDALNEYLLHNQPSLMLVSSWKLYPSRQGLDAVGDLVPPEDLLELILLTEDGEHGSMEDDYAITLPTHTRLRLFCAKVIESANNSRPNKMLTVFYFWCDVKDGDTLYRKAFEISQAVEAENQDKTRLKGLKFFDQKVSQQDINAIVAEVIKLQNKQKVATMIASENPEVGCF